MELHRARIGFHRPRDGRRPRVQRARRSTAVTAAVVAALVLGFAAACRAATDPPPAAPAASAAAPAGAQRWDLGHLYPTPAAWDAAYAALRERAARLPDLQQQFGTDAASMLSALDAISNAQRTLGRLYVYAWLKADEDTRDALGQERKQQAQALNALIEEKASWVTPAIQRLGADRVRGFLAAEPRLRSRFDMQIEEALRHAPHTLSVESEALLAAGGIVLAQPGTIYQQLADAELPRPTVTLSDGRTVTLTQDVYEVERRAASRADRKAVFDAFFGGWKRYEGTVGAMLAAQIQGDVYAARARKFGGTMEAALFSSNMPPAVYRTLVEQARAGLPTLHRYLKLRQRVLGVEGPLAYYDAYPPLVPEATKGAGGPKYDLATSQAVTLRALAPLGDEYLGLLRRGFAAPWTDSHPRPGKASGAYVFGWAYDVHPYVLLNHTDDFQSLSTLAHEWGHAVHTLLSNGSQPFEKAGYSTFIAESASIGNEMLLSDHLVATAATRADRMRFVAEALESIRTTFFRQTMFAEFQLAVNEEVERGKPLSGQRISELYCGIARAYYGQAQGVMTVDPAYCNEWMYIGHFYRGYYVWQYATSIAGAAEFAAAIAREGAPARDRFIRLLKAGGSDHPYPLYKAAGIDLARPEPYRALMARMNRLIDEFERLSALPAGAGLAAGVR